MRLRALIFCLLAFAVHAATQRFEAVSLKHVGSYRDGERVVGSIHYTRPSRPVQLTGTRLSGEVPLNQILRFAFSPLVNPYYCDAPEWMYEEYYQIDARAAAGTTENGTRAMLRTTLADRLGLQYHLVDRERKILALVRGSGALNLTPSTEPEPDPGLHHVGIFKNKSASLADFAGFLSWVSGSQVIDKTGIPGRYKFDVDWSEKIEGPPGSDPSIAYAGVQKLGLKLEAAKDMQKTVVIDRANKEPTPN